MTMETHVFDTMGTVASIRCVGGMPRREVLDAVEGTFEALEAWFSLYRPESEISRIARGDLSLTASSGLFRDTYARALEWRSLTNDAFTPHRPDGVIDLSGIVKADAMDAAGRVLEAAGIDDWLLNVGGDVLAHGAFGGASWQVGVADPDDRTRLLCAVALESPRQALATSGVAERGEHIWRSDRQRSDDRRRYRQASVLARSEERRVGKECPV